MTSDRGTRHVEGAAVKSLLMRGDVFVLDVRTPFEFQGGALPHAKLIPVDVLHLRLDELPVKKETPILVYCAHGVRSLYATELLEKNGYTEVFNLKGGITSL